VPGQREHHASRRFSLRAIASVPLDKRDALALDELRQSYSTSARSRILREAGATLNTVSVSGSAAKRRLRRGRAGQVRRGNAAQGVGEIKEMSRLHLLNYVQKLVNSGLLPGALASGESRGFQG
jgi:hypothetical protein